MQRGQDFPAAPTLGAEIRETGRLATPLALAQMGTMLMGVVDTAVVSRFDPVHAAGTTLGNSLAMGCLVFGMGLSIALEPLMAQAHGAGEEGRAWGWWRTGLRVSLIAALPLAILAIALALGSESLFGISKPIHDEGLAYLLARTPGNMLLLAWMAARSFLQSHQVVKPLLVGAAVANVVNLFADLALVDGFVQWGAAGAGIATSASTLVLVLWLTRAIKREKPPAGAVVPPGDVGLLLKLGMPLGLQLAAEFIVFSAAGILATKLGENPGNAHQIALHCTTMTFMAAVGISGATAARVGEAVGMHRMDLLRVRARAGFLLTLMVMGVSALCFAFLAGPIVALFAPKSAEVARLSVELLGIAALFQFFDGTQVLVSGALRGAGDVRFPFILTVVGYWGVGFPVAVLLCYEGGLGLHGLWYGLTAGLMAAALSLTVRYLWIERRGIERLER